MAERASVNEEIDRQDYSFNQELENPDYSPASEKNESADDENEDTQKIREQIEETRQDLSETINALQEKLSFENISEQVTEQVSNQISSVYQKTKETIFDNTIKTAGVIMKSVNKGMQNSKIYNIAKENPLPLFLIALGTGLLFFNKPSRKTNYRLKGNDNRKTYENGETQWTDALGKTRDKLSETASSAYQSTTEFADNAYQSFRDTANKTYEKVSDLGSQARDQYDHYLHENPLAVGAVALAAGVGVGLMLPTTSYEENLMGETSRNLLAKAKDKTTETVQTLKSAAGQAADTLKEAAGQAADDFKEDVIPQGQQNTASGRNS